MQGIHSIKNVRSLSCQQAQFQLVAAASAVPNYLREPSVAKLLSQFKLPIIATGGIKQQHQIIELQRYNVAIVGL